MRRLRIVLVGLGVALAVPVLLLVVRASEGERLERELRHQTVAARVFDEMERRLTGVLEHEESRPFEAYQELASPEATDPRDLPPFVIGHFQIDPDGTFHARRAQDLEPGVRAALEGEAEPARRGAPPATTLVRETQGADAPATEGSEDAYDLLSRLNLATRQRAARKQQVREEPVAKLYGAKREAAVPAEPPPRPDSARVASAERGPGDPRRDRAAPAPEAALRGLARVEADEVFVAEEAQAPLPLDDATSAKVRVALDPMVGRAVGDDRLLLTRTVLVGERGYRQGVVLKRSALAAWLEAEVLAPRDLGGLAHLRFDAATDAAWAPADHLVFGHHFAEPFDSMSAQLALAPLPDRAGASALSIYALAGLLLLVAATGLFAVDRMARLVVAFAERRSRFVASVSHELKTPLTAIRMYAEMLRDGLVQDEAKREEYYRTITDESERLSRLIGNVLEFSRLERGRREIDLSVGALPDVLEEAAEKLRPHVERQGFRLRIVAAEDLPAVRFDRDAMLQVLFNLVDNAIKYARPASSQEIVLEARRDGERALVCVRDFGPGVEGRHLARIFEPFYRAEEELTRTAKGSGIGLALVRELGQAMGAAVSGANAEGGGFRVSLAFEPAGG